MLKPRVSLWPVMALLLMAHAGCGNGAGSPAPTITSFGASKTILTVGDTTILTASFINGTGAVAPSIGGMTSGQSVTVAPAATTDYTLTVTNTDGKTAHSKVTISVPPRPRSVGFYIHGGWLFDYPFAPRSWQRGDYSGMFSLLKKMGYDTVMLWPLLEAIPMPLTVADRGALTNFRPVIQDGRDAGLRTWLAFCPNLTTVPSIGALPWQQRNPYPYMRIIRFDGSQEASEYLAHRRALISIVNNADGYVTIDGDPGGYEGAKAQDFVNLLLGDQESLRQFGAHASDQQVIPFAWSGWGQKHPWAESIEPYIRAELEMTSHQLVEPWALMAGRLETSDGDGRTNMRLVQEYGLGSRSMLMFYQVIEPEPIGPSTDLKLQDIRRVFLEETALYGAGASIMGSAQQPIMKLPGIYFFCRIAKDPSYMNKSDDEVLQDVAAFLGGPADLLLPAWKCLDLSLNQISADLPTKLRSAKLTTDAASLIPGGTALYLDLLAAHVESRRGMLTAMALPHTNDAEATAAVVGGVEAFVGWWNRHHFVMGNDPGASFMWDYVHSQQYSDFLTWVKNNVANKPVVAQLAVKSLVQHGTLTESVAISTINKLFGL